MEREQAQRSRPSSAIHRPGTAGRERDGGGMGRDGREAAYVPAPWELPQPRVKGLRYL
jgi:hypothetical protein